MNRIDGTQIKMVSRETPYWGQSKWWFELKNGDRVRVSCSLQGWIDIAEMEPPQGIDCAHYLHDDTPYEPEYEGDTKPPPSVTVGQFYGMKTPRQDGLIEMINENARSGHRGPCVVLCNRWQPMPVAD